MGAEGAVRILYRRQLQAAEDPEALHARLTAEFRARFANPYKAASTGHIDDVLRPRETRPRLIAALEMLRDKRVRGPLKKHGNMPV